MNLKTKSLVLSTLAVVSIMVITSAITYAFFNYVKEGTTDNIITTGSITFLYTEVSGVGNGISIENAFPMSDEKGKVLTKEGEYFDFKITSNTMIDTSIPYEVTARKKSTSTLDEEAVKLYLTRGETEEEVLLAKYSDLNQTDKVDSSKYTEKTIYTGKVPANTEDYEENFRLRMWISEDTDFSDGTMNDKEFIVTVNVYANAKVVTEEEIALESNATISSLSIDDTELTASEGQDYDYIIRLDEGTTSTKIEVETENEHATVNIEKVDSLVSTTNVKRLSTVKTLMLEDGDNYFKITVTSENKEIVNEYKLKVVVLKPVELEGFAKIIYNSNNLIDASPTLTTSSNNTSDASGLYKSVDTNDGNPTYYFRGNVTNNYVKFAGFIWRIVRINEDGTIRMIMQDGINDNKTYIYYNCRTNKCMYYTNSNAKTQLTTWYNTYITSNDNYSNKVAAGDYFCHQAKTAIDSRHAAGSKADMIIYSSYIPSFKCETDANGYGILNTNIGLITYDELVYAGGYYNKANSKNYLYNGNSYWSMSPAGYNDWDSSYSYVWYNNSDRVYYSISTGYYRTLRPVINLKPDVTVTGSGISGDEWVVE